MSRVISYLAIVLLINSCNDSKKPEVIDTTDKNYVMTYQDLQMDFEFNFNSPEWEKVRELLEKQSLDNPEKLQKPGFTFRSIIYVSEKGKIDKIVITESISKNVDESVVDYLKSIKKISPPEIDGQPVKSHTDFTFNYSSEGLNFFPRIDNFILPPPPPPPSNYLISADEMPMPIGGMKNISNRIVYPKKAKQEGIEGKVIIKLFINELGNPENSELLKGVHPLLDSEARDVLMNTKFIPGRKDGKAVKVQVSIPIVFKLN